MQLFPGLAQKIVEDVTSVITERIIVVDAKGTIIASSDEERVGTFHKGALQALQDKKTIIIDHQTAERIQGVKPGINVPILFGVEPIGVLGITGPPEKVQPFAELLKRMTELLVQEAYHTQHLEWQERGLESFVYEWVNLNEIDEDFRERGEILGLSMSAPYLVTIIEIEIGANETREQQVLEREMMEWFYRHFPKNKRDFLISWGQGRFAFLKLVERELSQSFLYTHLSQWKKYFEENYDVRISVGIGKDFSSQVIGQSYREAKKALKSAKKKQGIIFYEELLLDLLIQDIPHDSQEAFLNRTISPIHEDEDLMETLKVYLLENQSIKQTSEKMHVHINTLHYRLKQIKERTGIDPKDSEGIVLFYLALSLNVQTTKVPR